MSRASLLTPSTDYMPALLECLERIGDMQERTAGAVEELADVMREIRDCCADHLATETRTTNERKDP